MTVSRGDDIEDRIDEALSDFLKQRDGGSFPNRDAFLASYPEIATELRSILEAADCIEHMAGPTRAELTESDSRADALRHSESNPVTTNSENHFFPSFPGIRNDRVLDQSEPEETLAFVPNANTNGGVANYPLPTSDSTQPNLPCRFGEYLLEKILGRGGMGVVYAAKQLQLDRPVAIKMIRSGCLASTEEIQRFYAEARSAAKLDHPNIVTVYQCGECEGHHYFSMDYVPGTDLAKRIASGPMNQRIAARYVRDVARAISYAHEQGILHRDLKPANVLIDERDQVVITDFGLAKLIGAESGLTATGAALGTPSYMSPEQAGGRGADQSQSTDIYSLGAILFALLTGRPPFQCESVLQTIMQVMHKPAPPVRQFTPHVDSDLETITEKCLQKQPARRYASAGELADDLDRYLSGRPIQARPHTTFQRTTHWASGIPLIAAVTGHRSIEPSLSHRIAQWLMLFLFACIPLIYFSIGQSGKWWIENHLPRQIHIAAGNRDGVYHSVASHLAQRLEASIGHQPAVVSTDGSTENLARLLRGDVQLALLQASSVRGARISVVAPLYYEAVHLLVHRGVDATDLKQLRGKRLALGPRNSGTRLAAKIIFEQDSLSEQDFQVLDMDWNQLAGNNEVDAALVVIQTGHNKINELLGSGEYCLLPLVETLAISLNEPTFRAVQLSSVDYPLANIKAPIATLATTAFLSVQSNAPSRLVRASLEALYNSSSPIPDIMSAQRAAHWQGLAWHPAAREFFEKFDSQPSSK